jgi:hypothetical protein
MIDRRGCNTTDKDNRLRKKYNTIDMVRKDLGVLYKSYM